MSMNKKAMFVAIFVAMAIAATMLLSGCESLKRGFKTLGSDYTGGLDRTAILYDYNGKEIKRWEGRFDVSDDQDVVSFDLNGKRVIIKGGITVIEEN